MTGSKPRILTMLAMSALMAATALGGDIPATPSRMTVFTSRPGRFRVAMPARPVYATHRVSTQVGVITNHMYSVRDNGYEYMVAWAAFPSGRDPHAALEGACAKVLENRRLVKKSNIALQGHPGRLLIVDDGNTHIAVTMYMVGSRLYQVVFAMPRNAPAPDNAVRFMKSFRLV